MWEHNVVITHNATPDNRPKQTGKADSNYPQMKTSPLTSLGVLCDDGCTIKIDKQDM